MIKQDTKKNSQKLTSLFVATSIAAGVFAPTASVLAEEYQSKVEAVQEEPVLLEEGEIAAEIPEAEPPLISIPEFEDVVPSLDAVPEEEVPKQVQSLPTIPTVGNILEENILDSIQDENGKIDVEGTTVTVHYDSGVQTLESALSSISDSSWSTIEVLDLRIASALTVEDNTTLRGSTFHSNKPVLNTLNVTFLSGSSFRIEDGMNRMQWLTRFSSNAVTLGDHAFSYTSNLTEVSLPNATTFGDHVFRNSNRFLEPTLLRTVSLPNATTFGDFAFSYTSSLTEVSLPNATTFGDNAFNNHSLVNQSLFWESSLRTVSLPNATTFGHDAFRDADSVTEVSLPKATTFGNNAFYDMSMLTEVSLPNATTFGNSAFEKMVSLRTVSLPKATTFGDNAFVHLGNIETVSLPEATTFGNVAFFENRVLKEISLPKATTFGDLTFSYNGLLTEISLPNATTFGDRAFDSRNGFGILREVSLPSVTTLGKGAFERQWELRTVEIGIDENQFSNIDSTTLSQVTNLTLTSTENLTNSNTSTGLRSFTNLEHLTANSNQVGDGVLSGFGKLKSVDMPNVTMLGNEAFKEARLLTEVSLPKATTFGTNAFENAGWMYELSLPATTTMGKEAFKNAKIGILNLPEIETIEETIQSSTIGFIKFKDSPNLDYDELLSTSPKTIGIVGSDPQSHTAKVGETVALSDESRLYNTEQLGASTWGIEWEHANKTVGTDTDLVLHNIQTPKGGKYRSTIWSLNTNPNERLSTDLGVHNVKISGQMHELDAPQVNPITDVDTVLTGNGETGATIKVMIDGIVLSVGEVDSKGTFALAIPQQPAGTILSITQSLNDTESNATEVVVSKTEVIYSTENHFKLGYWQSYGLVIEGQLLNESWDLSSKAGLQGNLQLVNEDGVVEASSTVVSTNWYDGNQYNGYQGIIDTQMIESLSSVSGLYEIRLSLSQNGTELANETIPLSGFSGRSGLLQNYTSDFLNLPSNHIGTSFVTTKQNNQSAHLKIEKETAAIMGLISEAVIDEGRAVNGYLLNTDFDFNKEHQKNVIIETRTGEAVALLENVHTWDLSDWGIGVSNLDMLSGFQVIIPKEYNNPALYQYKMTITEPGNFEIEYVRLLLDKII